VGRSRTARIDEAALAASAQLNMSFTEQAGRKLVPCGGFPDATRRVIFDW